MGFDVDKFVSKVSEERKCSLCHLVLDNPVKTACCHVFCSGCILPWVVRHGKCPHNCQSLTPKDLENILPLRETILNMHVRCNFLDRGCQAVVRLTDVEAHVQDCTFRPVQCPNRGCEEIVSYKDVSKHENTECSFRKIGVCKKGCDLELYLNTVENHDCLTALNDQIKWKESKIYTLETEMKRLVSKFDKREKSLLVQLTNLRNELKSQAEYFQNKLCDYSHKIGLVKTDNEREDQVNLTIVLRKENNTLGFNIMGGYTPENNNNEEKKEMDTSSSSEDGIIVSRLTDNGPAEKSGLLLEDRIIKVNGTDLSQSSHEEAVEAFRTAKEPIVVEVLRRVNKTKMKNRSPTMVSIGTQTEEDIYGYNRPPTPPPAIYPFHSSGLYQPSSRRPVAFSPSADMGLTDIEMAHALEYDDAYFEERAYDVEYEEVVLHRSSTNEKLGLTLCYGSLEDEMTDIFISEVDPCSIAAQDGRIREGDQILQINGIDVHSRDQAIKLFSEQSSNITLLLARPQLQLDDGFMEDQNVVLDDLHMDILEKHHHDNMQIMASMLARGHIDEEGGTTDTATTENSLHKHEKDSGVGRTDESTKNDESSEQETLDTECTNSPAATTKFRQCYNLNKHEQIYSDESFLSHDCTHDVIVNDIPSEECDKFREVLARRFSNGIENSPRNDSVRKDSHGSIEHELALLNKEMEQIQLECEEIVQSHLCEQNISQKRENTPYKSPRIVPRMGTRLEYLKHVQSYDSSEKDVLTKQGQSSSQLEKDKDATSTSAYNTGESCRSTPLTLELNPASDEGEKGFKNSMLCLAPTASTMTPSLSDTEKQTQTPCSRSKDGSSDDNLLETSPGSLKDQGGMGESLQDLYVRYADVMYTNHANLQHTIAIQQKLFQQQLEQKPRYAGSPQPGSASSRSTVHQPDDFHAQGSPNMTPPDSSSQMEWVVKRRPDGTRYITRRPVRSKMLKERAKKISEERCGMTTDDDAMSELKTGRYWSKEDRKRHLEKAKDQKRRRELMMKAKMETLKETEEKKEVNIVELSHRKMNKRKGKKVLDNFVTVQEMMAHGSRVQDGKTYNPLLSVTTV